MLNYCPFCGDTVHIQYESDAKAFSVWHDRKRCKFLEPLWIDGEYAKSLSEAYDIWNERAVLPMRWVHDGSHWENRYICSNCGYKLIDKPTKYCPECGFKRSDSQ